MENPKKVNIAYIDGQNLHLGTVNHVDGGWHIDYVKFRKYLYDKYDVVEAYYYLGCIREKEQDLYTNLQLAGFILKFREHTDQMMTKKKGNVDSDIIFDVMKNVADETVKGKIILVSGDGDYKSMAKYLLKQDRLGHILFPNQKFASSLYNNLGLDNFSALDEPDVRAKIEYIKKKAP